VPKRLKTKPAWLVAVLATDGRCGLVDVQVSIIYRLHRHSIACMLPSPSKLTFDGLSEGEKEKVMRLYEWLREHAVITPSHARTLLSCSYPTARRYLALLRKALGLPPKHKFKNSTLKACDVIYHLSLKRSFSLATSLATPEALGWDKTTEGRR